MAEVCVRGQSIKAAATSSCAVAYFAVGLVFNHCSRISCITSAFNWACGLVSPYATAAVANNAANNVRRNFMGQWCFVTQGIKGAISRLLPRSWPHVRPSRPQSA